MNNLSASVNETVKKQPLVVALVAFIVGLIIGLPVLGWGLMPVEWKDGDVAHLHPDWKREYATLVANSYALDSSTEGYNRAKARLDALGTGAAGVLDAAIGAASGAEKDRLTSLKTVMEATGDLATLGGGAAPAPGLLSQLGLPLLGCGAVIILGVVGFILYSRMGGFKRAPTKPKPGSTAAKMEAMEEMAAAMPASTTPFGEPPIQRFMTTYTLGDDQYDDSFSVDGPDGNFYGECGMGISETIGVGDPKKVTAFEVWLFDKNDIRTVTKVIMSDHAFRDEALKSRLAAKGEPVQAGPGDTVSLETATLVVTARMVDMAYGGGALPPSSFFERITIELAAYKKPAA